MMDRSQLYETPDEKKRRERNENIVREYMSCSPDILEGFVTPGKVIRRLHEKYGMTIYGVTCLLKRKGIYKGAQNPVARKPLKVEAPELKSSELPVSTHTEN
jgi:hypothetical protein